MECGAESWILLPAAMKQFLKKYWLNIAIVLLMGLLLVLYVPAQEKGYINTTIKAIEKISGKITFVVLGLVLLAGLVLYIKQEKKISALPVIPILVIFLLPFYFILTVFIKSGIYFMNGVLSKEKINKEYRIISTGNSTKFNYLFDREDNKIVSFESLGFTIKPKIYADGDTVSIVFDKGLLGYLHNPEIIETIQVK
jgi:amino acid transporter